MADERLVVSRGSTVIKLATMTVEDYPRLPDVGDRTLSVGVKSFGELAPADADQAGWLRWGT